MLKRCLDSVKAVTNYPDYEVVLVDNGSRDAETTAYVEELSASGRATVLRMDAPFNFSRLNNLGERAARGDHLLFLNDDTEVLQTDWLDRMVGWSALAHVGAVGAKLLLPDGSVQHCGVATLGRGPGHAFYRTDPDTPLAFGRNLLEYDWSAVTGACLMTRLATAQACRGFDESYAIGDFEDSDLCLRINALGLHCAIDLDVQLYHLERQSQGDMSHSWRFNLTLFNAWTHQNRWRNTLEPVLDQLAAD